MSNSIITNNTAQIALESLNATNASLAATQKEISTGYRVADANDDGAAFAIAQKVRSDVGALTAANQQLGNAQGLLNVTTTGLTSVQNTLSSARATLVKLADANEVGSARTQDIAQYTSYVAQIKSFLSDSNYNGQTLIAKVGGAAAKSVNVISNEVGSTYNIASVAGATGVYHAITLTALLASTTTTSVGSFAALITANGTFVKQISAVGTYLNTLSSEHSYVGNQVTFNSDKIDSLNSGLGSLIDADLAKESARLQSLQIQQQLGTQALSIANQSPSSLLSLFK